MVPVSVVVPFFIAPCDASGPTLPWLDAPPVGWAVCAKAAGEASAKMQAEAKMIFFLKCVSLVLFIRSRKTGRSSLSFLLSIAVTRPAVPYA